MLHIGNIFDIIGEIVACPISLRIVIPDDLKTALISYVGIIFSNEQVIR